jgi:hypothetical protein
MKELIEATRSVATTAHDSLTLIQRPWLGGIGTIKTGSDNADFSVRVKNYGPVPAVRVGLQMNRFPMAEFRSKIGGLCNEAKRSMAHGRYIFPGEADYYPLGHRFVTVSVGAPVDATQIYGGCIAYLGEFNDFHHTEFCFVREASGQGVIPCTVEQKAD